MIDPQKTSVLLDTDEIEFTLGTQQYRLLCDVVLDVNPNPRVSFRVKGLEPFSAWAERRPISFHLLKADVRGEAFVGDIKGGVVSLSPTEEPIPGTGTSDLVELQFDLINFPTFWAMTSSSTRGPKDHLDVVTADWCIEIREPRKSLETEVFRSELYLVTHSCLVRKNDKRTFTSKAAQDLLKVVHDVMTFAAGRWVAPIYVKGLGRDQNVIWKEWGTRPLHPNLSRLVTWFDAHHGESLIATLSGALSLYTDSTRAEKFHTALYWYVRSSAAPAGVDGGIILLQAALERLAWQRLVSERKALSPDGFGRISADDKIRLLIEHCEIPKEIPGGLGDLHRKGLERNWDGPKAITEVRNQLVHPKHGGPFPYYDAWRLAEWYVELVLLRTIGYDGKYFNRTKAVYWVGDVDSVPWAKPE